MEGEVLKICAVAVLCAIVGVILGKLTGSVGVAVKLAGLALVFGGAAVFLGEIVEAMDGWGFSASVAEYTSLMLRALGIGVICRVCADICRDCGEGTVASAVEMAGKLAIILLSASAVGDLMRLATELADKL